MSTLLQKANQIKAEKDTKVIPSNIKAGVTMFGVTGTYTGPQLIDLSEGNQVVFHTDDLATLLSTALDATQKAGEITLVQSAPSTIISLGNCTYTPNGGSAQTNATIDITVFNGDTINLSITDEEEYDNYHVIAQITSEEAVSGDWAASFTVQDFIGVLEYLAQDHTTATLTSELTTGDTAEVDINISSIVVHVVGNTYTVNTSGTTILEGVSE